MNIQIPDTLNISADTLHIEADPNAPVYLRLNPHIVRFNLRTVCAQLTRFSEEFGITIPDTIHTWNRLGTKSALCLGPDEWQLQIDPDEKEEIINRFAALGKTVPHSLSDISDRQISIEIGGPKAIELLSIGCPRDLSTLSVGKGTRTLFDTVEVTIFRQAATTFHLEVWRSFFPHVWALLNTGTKEIATGL
ncbi:sarcosine oxidase subunit gamma [Sneathiella aquimaris]|uniref:sarcosine oxidase subunit gamma n=1 Tax=Sneathiella aquimaris TaxID=2599305 RepID=UPI00146B4BAE|nr:sarcosine oxidase subunit gamma family protein [Sneathiella aquimaris]